VRSYGAQLMVLGSLLDLLATELELTEMGLVFVNPGDGYILRKIFVGL
jgi:hypothetical protein